jgi:hypothetical protein
MADCGIRNSYGITEDLKDETDIIANNSVSPIG